MRFVDGPVGISHTDPVKDTPNERLVYTDNGRTFKLLRKDPYGFVYIQWDRGATPDKIAGAFSGYDQARQALMIYLDQETFTEIVAEPVPPPEPIVYKKTKVANG
jgi:hypothetical protein